MLNLKELLLRYPQGLGLSLMWGGKRYYKANESEPYNLNSTSSGFVLNNFGRVQCYSIVEEKFPVSAILIDLEKKHTTGGYTWWDQTLECFYPHPWYPKRKIISFTCLRNCPSFSAEKEYEVSYFEDRFKNIGYKSLCSLEQSVVASNDGKTNYGPEDLLKYPEFFRPEYE